MGCGASAAVGAGAPANAQPQRILEPGLPSDWLTVKIVPVGKDMYPEDAPHVQVIELDKTGKKLVYGVGVGVPRPVSSLLLNMNWLYSRAIYGCILCFCTRLCECCLQ